MLFVTWCKTMFTEIEPTEEEEEEEEQQQFM